MLLFGRTLLGGALVAGYVTVSGVAACSATATGQTHTYYKASGNTESIATAVADGLRVAIVQPQSIEVHALATAKSTSELNAQGVSSALASAYGAAHASLYAKGLAQSSAHCDGVLYRRMRMTYQPPAKACASGSGEVVSYVLAISKTAYARAKLVGTSHHVGLGVASAVATLNDDVQKIVAIKQGAQAVAGGSAIYLYTAGASGSGSAVSLATADAAVTMGGVRYFELFGEAKVSAKIDIGRITIFQPQLMRALAKIYADAVQARGFEGKGVAAAKVTGYMDMTYTGQEGSPAAVAATATGYCVRHAMTGGSGSGVASAADSATARFNGAGIAQLTASAQALTIHFLLANQHPATATAAAHAYIQHINTASGLAAQAFAGAEGYNQINDLLRAPQQRTHAVESAARISIVYEELRRIAA